LIFFFEKPVIKLRTSRLFVWWCITQLSTIFLLSVEETGEPGKNHRPVASNWQTISHNVVHLALIEIWTNNISGDRHWCIGSCKSNYHTIMATMVPIPVDIILIIIISQYNKNKNRCFFTTLTTF
jgi:hypothetical protein